MGRVVEPGDVAADRSREILSGALHGGEVLEWQRHDNRVEWFPRVAAVMI